MLVLVSLLVLCYWHTYIVYIMYIVTIIIINIIIIIIISIIVIIIIPRGGPPVLAGGCRPLGIHQGEQLV